MTSSWRTIPHVGSDVMPYLFFSKSDCTLPNQKCIYYNKITSFRPRRTVFFFCLNVFFFRNAFRHFLNDKRDLRFVIYIDTSLHFHSIEVKRALFSCNAKIPFLICHDELGSFSLKLLLALHSIKINRKTITLIWLNNQSDFHLNTFHIYS